MNNGFLLSELPRKGRRYSVWLFLRGRFDTSKPPSTLDGTPALKPFFTDFENSMVTGSALPPPTKQREAAFCCQVLSNAVTGENLDGAKDCESPQEHFYQREPPNRAVEPREAADSSQPRPTESLGRTMQKQSAKPVPRTKVSTTTKTHYRRVAERQNSLGRSPKLGPACHLGSKPKTPFDWPELDSWLARRFYQTRQKSEAHNSERGYRVHCTCLWGPLRDWQPVRS